MKKESYVVYKCGCEEKIPKFGITGGKRCPKHREQLSKKVIWK